ncbi:MAG TPA: hypothetical protein VK105_07685 [Virgibacillus sp.]|nr:hypothetical protein [Virgibacillus sp.]HLR67004.1 hypothetical protein [Virgibacillus sp.]
MENVLDNYNYSRQFILVENPKKQIRKRLKSDLELIEIDDYQWKIVSTISMQRIDDKLYHLLQYEDKKLGWLDLEDSIQIFRFPAKHYKVIEEKFSNNEVNSNMNIEKDFISHFKGKLLNVKSQITFNGETYYSVFIKDKFHGFHHHSVLDPVIDCEIEVDKNQLDSNIEFYKISNLTKPVEEVLDVESIKLISVFKETRIGKVRINQSDNFWVHLDSISDLNLEDYVEIQKSDEELKLDDIFYSINIERNKSKEIMKTVLMAKDFLNDKKNKNKSINTEYLRTASANTNELENKYKELKNEKQSQDKLLRKTSGDLKLAENRLTHQKDYNKRLEVQKDKYKKRMETVEEKLKNLDARYKTLKEQINKN